MEIHFSIIIPTYNRAKLLPATIDSVLNQQYKNFEIIIIDDGSTDDTEEIIRATYSATPEVRYIRQANAERGAARNHGASLAKGDYINFFDSDDLMLPNHLSGAQKFLTNFRAEVFHMNYEIHNSEGKVIGVGPSKKETANEDLIKGNILSCNGVIIRKDIALENPFVEDRRLSALEDWELWLRLASKYRIVLVKEITTIVVNHDERSVLQTNKEKLIQRVNALIELVTQHEQTLNYYKKSIPAFKARCYTYVALHIAITKMNRSDALRFTLKGIREDVSVIFTRRFLAIIKHIAL